MNVEVIATSFEGKRHIRKSAPFPQHPQHITCPEDIAEMLETVVAYKRDVDAGVPVDLVIVVNGYSSPLCQRRVVALNGTKTKNGTVHVFHRSNIGGSFGAYSSAFSKYKNNYDYWLFTEDDILVGTDSYYRKLIECFESRGGIGFVSLVGVQKQHPEGVHAHGGVGLSRRNVLELVARTNNGLPHYRRSGWNKDRVIQDGEIPFTREIIRHGFELVDYCSLQEWHFEKKLCIPYGLRKSVH